MPIPTNINIVEDIITEIFRPFNSDNTSPSVTITPTDHSVPATGAYPTYLSTPLKVYLPIPVYPVPILTSISAIGCNVGSFFTSSIGLYILITLSLSALAIFAPSFLIINA